MLITHFFTSSVVETSETNIIDFVKVSLGKSCKSTPVDFVKILPDSSKGGATETKTNVRLICLDDFPVFGSH